MYLKYTRSLMKRFADHDLISLGAQCAYFLLLSLFPFLIFIVTLLTYLPFTFQDVYNLLEEDYVPPEVLGIVENQWEVLTAHQNTGLLSFSIIFTIWTASLALNSILRTLNLAYHVTERRGMIKARVVSISLTISMFLVVLTALVVQVIGSNLLEYIEIEPVILDYDVLRWLVSSVILFIVFSILYLVGPNTRLKIKEVYTGAIFATVGWQLTSLGFSYYLNNFANYTATYGSIGAVIALMVWFHLSSVIILFGGEINAARKEDFT
ncbi:YihY/virulence factor BrkB family protein [Bacillus sp. FJAT-44742]|uniref:YihY/virulence factor BrkB family protein n=1 Tax=Bacillus sp. FJAT-44742 TaxID=2014005 RepID=UPI000C23F7B7|nr:YihY/virulence factor BrkB family protein [Bacillus sp. FJAT-44742]